MIRKKLAPELIRGGNQFPAVAQPALPGEGSSEKIMLKQGPAWHAMKWRSGVPAICLRFCAVAVTAGCLAGPAQAQAQQQHPPKKPLITLPSLAAQGFEVKAAFSSYLVVQKGKDVWLCYMLQTRSDCEPAE